MKSWGRYRFRAFRWWGRGSRRARRPARARPCRFEWLQDRILLCGDGELADAVPIDPSGVVVEELHAGDESGLFQVTLAQPGRFTVETRPQADSPLATRTSLMDAEGHLLIQSEGQSPADLDDLIVQHLLAGTYFVQVEALGGGAGDFALVTQFDPATPPNEPLLVNFDHDYPFAVTPPYHVTGDFNGDGHLDIATPNTLTADVSVLLGLGDGSFQSARNFAVGAGPFGIVAADFNGDGRLDIATANQFSNDVSVLLATGNEQLFAAAINSPGGTFAWGMTTGDFNADGRPDLAINNLRTDNMSVRLGLGDGTFEAELRFAVGIGPNGVTTADFNGDGHLDVVNSNFNGSDASVLLGTGDGQLFAPEQRLDTGPNPGYFAAGDFNGDGSTDLAVNLGGDDSVAVFLGRGDGTFGSRALYAAGSTPYAVVAADFNGDGLVDLATSNRESNDVSVLLGRGDGTFQDQHRYRTGIQPWYILAGDFNEDGHLDLTTANARSHDVSILVGLGDGTFQQDPTDLRQGETNPLGMVARDFNHDGLLDLAAVTYLGHDMFVFLGRGDGTFQERMRFNVGSTPVELLSEDFNRDGHDDLASINCDSGDLSVLLGRGDGTFQDQTLYDSSVSGEWGVTGDFNSDGLVDVVASGQFATGIAFVPGRGDGTFGERTFFALDEGPADGASGDFNGDGKLDLATTNFFSPDHDVSVHLGLGDGTFEPPQHYPVGEFPLGIVSGDFNRDGNLDLVNANFRSEPGSVSLLLGQGDGTFAPEVRYATGLLPDFVLARDFDRDGRLDLVVSNAGTQYVSVLRGREDGTLAEHELFPAGDAPTPRRGLDAGDFNGDGRLDLAIPQVLSNDVAVLLGSGDARFAQPLRFPVGLGPVALAAGDFSGDGRLDVASVNPSTSELTISLGAGDTTLLEPRRFLVGAGPVAVVQGDFNRDGRLDLVTANYASSDVSLLLGLGTGAFQDQQRLVVGANPTALATGDFNADGRLDLATANATTSDVSILLGRGDGTLQGQQPVAAGEMPQSLVTGDFNRDGRLDLATANYRSNNITVSFGRGDGTFAPPLPLAVGRGPVSLVASDFNADGVLDLASANYLSHDASVLLGRGDGTFLGAQGFAAGTGPVSLTSGDFNSDDRLDLGVANSNSDDLTLLLGRGDGSFAEPLKRPAGDYPAALVSADFNGDARADLAIATQLLPEIAILQGLGDATFAAAGTISNRRHATPLVADFSGDRLDDVALLDLQGKILLRVARPGAAGFFEAPGIVNLDPRFAARDLAVVSSQDGSVLAALDAKNASLSFYSRQPDGKFKRQAGPRVPGKLPVAIRSGDLSGDGLLDLVVAAAGSNQVFVYLQSGGTGQPGAAGFAQLAPDYAIDVGVSPSAIELADVDADQRLDILVTSQFSGDVSVFYNKVDDPFSCEQRYRTGTGLYSLVEHDNRQVVRSLQAPAGMALGKFGSSGLVDLVVSNGGSNRLSVLAGSGYGGFLNASSEREFSTDLRPTVLVAGRFNGDPHLDVAVLNERSANVSIFLGTSDGGLAEQPARPAAGNMPTGLAVHDVNGDGRQDLLVGNDFGDLLLLLGNGDGTFQPYQRADGRVALAVADLDGDGRDDFVFANQANDAVEVRYSQSGEPFRQLRTDGLLAPEAVATADLNRDGAIDLIVANSGANNVLVYLGATGGQFASARSFFAGTSPVSVTVQELNGDALPDLVVANEGSNDVTILLGQTSNTGWTLANGPRLRAGSGPVQTIVRDETSDGVPDILVTNRQSNDVFLLAGLGLGFFDDRNPVIRQTGQQPRQILPLGGGLVTINERSNDITFFPSFLASPGFTFGSGGQRPVAGLVGNFNGDAFSDLLVAHQDSGVIRLLAGGPGGFSLANSFSHDELPHPAAIASVFRGQQIEIYGVNERGSEAVLITALSNSLLGPPDRSPVPLSGLLIFVAPGLELAMSVLTPIPIADDPAEPSADGTSEPAVADSPLPSPEGSGNARQTTDDLDPDDSDEPQRQAHERAILELLAGVAEALESRPPKLPWDEQATVPLDEAGNHQVESQWLHATLGWIANPEFLRLVELVALPSGVAPVADAALAVMRGWFPRWIVSRASEIPTATDMGDAQRVDRAELNLVASEPWTIDPWLAAACALGLVHGTWTIERRRTECGEIKSRRARCSGWPRPSS